MAKLPHQKALSMFGAQMKILYGGDKGRVVNGFLRSQSILNAEIHRAMKLSKASSSYSGVAVFE